ncbi:GlcG/HbpS family heme-binding protein [Allomesorhizobium camelthorni]|uniref:Heme-binding protein n=1 Tax=Allomesorhizobium camelthorni TaxID=475069 RepID=A0A6G4WJ96_9HYPH|nr:heme-binding protein [Mesorhizobium camelthorni]NGO54296.1 heme-binding protein [Mesorhizobium camelthorni]
MSITHLQADIAIAAAVREATAIGVPMNIAVYDDGANMKAFVRMDGAFLGSADIAQNKARTASLFGFNTEALYEFVKPGGTSPGFDRTNGGLIVFAGGIPVHDGEGRLIGAIGVSGGAVAQDYQVAEAAITALAAGGFQEQP